MLQSCYVTSERALKDYGVVVKLGSSASQDWTLDAEVIARRYRTRELGVLDLILQYGVVVDWGTGELLPRTTAQTRVLLHKRAAEHWD